MTDVTRIIPGKSLTIICARRGVVCTRHSRAHRARATPPSTTAAGSAPQDHSAEALYSQLRTVGLDKSRVYNIREVTLDRAAFHITFDDGTIAFTEDVAGQVTGAFFEGEGEVLLAPPNQSERASMMLFTGAAILEQRFVTAYFRFNDDTFAELQPSLRPAANPQEFVTQWNPAARNLAEPDALRLLLSFSKYLPSSGSPQPMPRNPMHQIKIACCMPGFRDPDLGTFDLYFDSLAAEQVLAGQLKTVEGQSYYDVWTSFSLGQPAGPDGRSNRRSGRRSQARGEST